MSSMQTSVFKLDNLDCADCATKLEQAVQKLEQVETAQVNLIANKITVRHQGGQGSIRSVIAHQGYLAKENTQPFWRQARTIATLTATVLLLLSLLFPAPLREWIQLTAVAIGGFFPARSGLKKLIFNRTFDIDFLMLVAVLGAVYIGELGEAATVVVLFAASHALEAYTMGRTRNSVHNLLKMAPDTAWIEEQGQLVAVSTASLEPGQNIVIKPGERVPVDGEIVSGTSELNQAQVTGESMPVVKTPGQEIFAGSINGSGSLVVKTTKSAAQSTLARIVAMVEEASTTKPPSQQFVDSFARWYTPVVMGLAVLIATLPPLVMGFDWSEWAYRGLALLVVACPCALVISTPVSIVSALGNAARQGVLIKNGAALEEVAAINTIAMDKTGTLTQGTPQLIKITPTQGRDDTELLALAAGVEQGSSHPLAAAVVAAAQEQDLQPTAGSDFQNLPGHGAKAKVNGSMLYTVSPAFARAHLGLSFPPTGDNTTVVLANENSTLGQFEFQDALRPGAQKTIAQLREQGIETVMLTGDNVGAAANIASRASIKRYHAQLLPEHKLNHIEELRNNGKVMMVGDGINDAPALAAADIGVAMGAAGSDTALETADIALMSDDLHKLPFLFRLSRKALNTIRANIWFSILIKLVAVLLVFPGWLTLWLAILADTGAAVLVTLNSMRLLRAR